MILATAGDGPAMQFAATHVVLVHVALNVLSALILLPLVGSVAAVVRRALPTPAAAEATRTASHIFLAPEDVGHPRTALINTSPNEAARVAHIVYGMIGGITELFRHGDAVARIKSLEDDVDRLYREVTLYMASIKLDALDEDERRQWFELFEFITHLEHVGDIITRNIIDLAKRKRKAGLDFSPDGARELEGLTAELSDIFRDAQAVFLSRDPHRAEELVAAKRRFRTHTMESQRRHAMRLSSGGGVERRLVTHPPRPPARAAADQLPPDGGRLPAAAQCLRRAAVAAPRCVRAIAGAPIGWCLIGQRRAVATAARCRPRWPCL